MLMGIPEYKKETISRLRRDILRWQGLKPAEGQADRIGLGPVESAFPNGVFPFGSIHEFISYTPEQTAASSGFMAGLLASLINGGACLWISRSLTLFPPSLKFFGIEPHQVLFVYLRQEKEVLWAMEEALKCEGLSAVVCELQEVDFIQSRRLQLAVEKSGVTGLVLRNNPRYRGATACAARWHIKPIPSLLEEGLPGVGFPRWNVELLKVRNGSPGSWLVEWSSGRFHPIVSPAGTAPLVVPGAAQRSGSGGEPGAAFAPAAGATELKTG